MRQPPYGALYLDHRTREVVQLVALTRRAVIFQALGNDDALTFARARSLGRRFTMLTLYRLEAQV